MSTSVEELTRLIGQTVALKRVGTKSYMGRCPGHDDKSASLHVFQGRKGARFYCHAHCPINGEEDKGGDIHDWHLIVTGERQAITWEDPEVRRRRLQEEEVARVRETLCQKFLDRYLDTPTEAFGLDLLESVNDTLRRIV